MLSRLRYLLIAFAIVSIPSFVFAATGDTSTFLGKIYDGDNGKAINAYIDMPQGFTMDESGVMYIADTINNVIRKIDTDGIITTYSGTGEYGKKNGAREKATWATPEAIIRSSDGIFYIADTGNSLIRKIENNQVSTIKVTGSKKLKNPRGLLLKDNALYISDTGNNRIVRVSKSGGILEEVATGLNYPLKMAMDGNSLFIANYSDKNIIKVNTDTKGSSVFAESFEEPKALAIYDGYLYLVCSELGVWNELWKIDLSSGSKTRLRRQLESESFNTASDISIRVEDGKPMIYETHSGGSSIYKLDLSDITDTKKDVQIAGVHRFGDSMGNKNIALLGRPTDIVASPNGKKLYMIYSQGNKIAEYDFDTNEVSVVAGHLMDSYTEGIGGNVRFSGMASFAIGKTGKTIYTVERNNNRVRTLNLETKETKYLTGAGYKNSDPSKNNGYQEGKPCDNEFQKGVTGCAYFNSPAGIAITKDEKTIYIADTNNNRIRRVNAKTGQTSLIAGSGSKGFVNGVGKKAKFNAPYTLALSKNEKTLYVVDKGNHAVREINLKTKKVTTLVGKGKMGYREGAFSKAQLATPEYIETGLDGNLYISEAGSLRIRKLNLKTKKTSLLSGSGERGMVNGRARVAEWNNPKGMVFIGKTLYVADSKNDLIRAVNTK